jgi:hypothetical protein
MKLPTVTMKKGNAEVIINADDKAAHARWEARGYRVAGETKGDGEKPAEVKTKAEPKAKAESKELGATPAVPPVKE